jgi:hypothetical protein
MRRRANAALIGAEGRAMDRRPGESVFGMTTFDDRERGFEAKFAHEQETEFKVAARRNRLLGLWAAELMGLQKKHLEDYAKAVVRSDFEQPGDEDVLRKVFEDLKGAGVQVSEGDVRLKMDELMAVAREQIKAGA